MVKNIHYKQWTRHNIKPLTKRTKRVHLSIGLAKELNCSTWMESSKAFGSSKSIQIMHNEITGEITCNKQSIKVGRLIGAIFPNLNDTEIEDMVNKWKTKFTIDTSTVKVSDNIDKIYKHSPCGGSCMYSVPQEYFEIYKDMRSKIVYLMNDKNKLEARALFHYLKDEEGKEYTVMDRVFYNSQKGKLTLQKWRREQEGMTRFQYLDEKPMIGKYPINSRYEDGVPYVDNLHTAVSYCGEYYLATKSTNEWNYYDTLLNQEGRSEKKEISGVSPNKYNVYCEDIEELVHIDDAFYCETNGCYYYSEHCLVYIYMYGYYHEDDDTVAYDDATDEWDFKDNLKWIESENVWTSG